MSENSLRSALEKLKSYNEDILAGRINYRPEDHIAVARAALAATHEPEPRIILKCSQCGCDTPKYLNVQGLGCSECNPPHHVNAAPAGAPAASGREFDLEAIGEMMDRILAGQRELTPAEQKNLLGIYDKLFRKVEAAAPRPELARTRKATAEPELDADELEHLEFLKRTVKQRGKK